MSSFHLLNAVWVGVFPMLAVTLILGIICYIICCLNRIKIKCTEHCLNKQKRKAEARSTAVKTNPPRKKKKCRKKEALTPLSLPSYFPPPPTTPPPPQPLNTMPDRSSLRLNLINSNNPNRPCVVQKPRIVERQTTELCVDQLNYNRMSARSVKSLNMLDVQAEEQTCRSTDNIEQLIVQELNESPKSTYAKLRPSGSYLYQYHNRIRFYLLLINFFPLIFL